eukprot:gene19984-21943_t
MSEETSNSKQKGRIICQDGELEYEDPAVEEDRDEEESLSDDEESDGNDKRPKDEEILDLLQMLLNFRDNDTGTSLHYATKLDKTDIVRSLLAAGANPTLRNLEDATAYDYCKTDAMKTVYVGALLQAVAQSKSYRVKLLLQAGLDVNSGDGAVSDNRILHWAASFADAEIVRLLLDSNADVNATNADGATALHDAIARGSEEIVVELLNHGANTDIVAIKGSMEGKNCHDLAKTKPNIRNLLDSHHVLSRIRSDGSIEVAATISEALHGDQMQPDTPALASDTSSASSMSNTLQLLSPTNESLSTQQMNGDHAIANNGCNLNISNSSSSSSFKPILLPPKSPMKLFFPTMVALDHGVSHLWPPPQKISQYKGTSYVPPIDLPLAFMTSRNSSQARLSELVNIFDVMKAKFKSTGFDLQTDLLSSYSALCSCPKGGVECYIDESSFSHLDEYRLHISTRKVKIVASSCRSMFYAINTFLQCLRIFQGKGVPLLQISDWPDMNVRGVQFDFFQGDLPKLENILWFIDDLSGFKVNQIHLPAELFLPGDQNKYCYYSRGDLIRVHKFCQDRYMDVIPVVRSSDVLGNYNALSYASIKSDILPLFPSASYLSVSLSNLEDQQKTTRNMLSGITDSDLVRRIEELHEFCVSNGITLLLDSEMILQQPVKHLDLNHNLICLNISEEFRKEATCEYLYDLGIPHIDSPAHRNPETILKDNRTELKCFEGSSRKALKCGALGLVVRYEVNPCLSTLSIDKASMIVGAALAWRSSPSVVVDEEMLTGIINRHIYQDDNDVIGILLLTLGSIEQINYLGKQSNEAKLKDIELLRHQTINKPSFLKALLNSVDDLSNCQGSLENLKIVAVSLKQLGVRVGKCKLKCETREMVTTEVAFLIKILLFLCRVGMVLHKNRTDNQEIHIKSMTEIQRSDLSNKLMGLTDVYEKFCSTHYKETRGGLKSVQLLKTLLTKIYPETEPSFFNSITRAFNV